MTPPDQKFYDIVADELRSHSIVDGLWVRSFSEASGDTTKARAIYISYRVEQLKADEDAVRTSVIERAQASVRFVRDQRERVKREAKEKRAQELKAERQRSLDPKAKKLLGGLLLIVLLLLYFILQILTK